MRVALDISELPHSIEIEQALLGALLYGDSLEIMDRVSDLVTAEDFYEPLHAEVFTAIGEAAVRGERSSALTLKARFADYAPIGSLSVPQYLGRLAQHAGVAVSVESYARDIRALSIRRRLIQIGRTMEREANKAADTDAESLLRSVQSDLWDLSERRSARPVMSIGEAVGLATDEIEEAAANGGARRGIQTGLRHLDRMTRGMHPGQLIIVAARPSIGKSMLAMNVAINAAKAGVPGLYVSIEMSASSLGARVIAAQTGVSMHVALDGKLSRDAIAKVRSAGDELAELPLLIWDSTNVTLDDLRLRAIRAKRAHGTQFLVVDYLGIMNVDNLGLKRHEAIARASREIKCLAGELDIPIMLLVQINREADKRLGGRPKMGELRDSGALEQDADQVWLIHRPEVDLRAQQPDPSSEEYPEWKEKIGKVEGKGQLIVAKNRNGPTGVISLHFDGARMRFTSVASEYGDGDDGV